MRFRILVLLVFITLCSLPLLAHAATYNWYFSDDASGNAAGDDSTGDGSISNPWKTLQKAENVMKVKNSGDVVNLYFDRGDTWNFATNVTEVFSVETGDPVVHIRAYGSGNKPIFQGDISDFSTADFDGDNGYYRYNRVFHFEVEDCSVDNVEIKDVYGIAVYLFDADGFTLSSSLIHNVGASFLDTKGSPGGENVTIEYNTLHTGMQLHLYDLYGVAWPQWSQGISLFQEDGGPFRNNLIQYNLIYDVAGEGIVAPSSTIQYNVVGDTASVGIDLTPAAFDAFKGIARYNLVVMSDWSTSVYDDIAGGPQGIRIYDEKAGGDNSAADIEIYGNIVINRQYGIWVFSNQDPGNPFGSVKIYNNLIIDSHIANITLANPEEFTALYFYNNASIFYDRDASTIPHILINGAAGGGWDISNNAYYHTTGTHTIDAECTTGQELGNPVLPGAATATWTTSSGAGYYNAIEYTTHLYPISGSLIQAGLILNPADYEQTFLTTGSDFSDVLNWPTGIDEAEQSLTLPDIGPWARGTSDPVPLYPIQGAAGNFKYN